MSVYGDVQTSLAKLQARVLGIRGLLIKHLAALSGDAATVAGADQLIAQAKFALVDEGRAVGKDMSATVTAANGSDGIVAGIASTDDMDLYRHVIVAGAFSDAIRKRGLIGPNSIKLLLDHDHRQPAGVIRRLQYNGGRLEIEAQLNLEIEAVRDRLSAMKMIGGFNFSVGFMLEDYEIKSDANKVEYLQINRGDLFEVSLVAFPGNEAATLTTIKAHPPVPTSNPLEAAELGMQRAQAALALLKGTDQ